MNKITIAIDGYSSCGKSTLAKALANNLGYAYIDTGAMYRSVTLYALENGLIEEGVIDKVKVIESLDKIKIVFRNVGEKGASAVHLNNKNVEREIREMNVAEHVSQISVIKEVRTKMVELQQAMGEKKGIVMEGRDIGTVVFPDAELKLFMTADMKTRVKRRYEEMKAKGMDASLDEVKENVKMRDYEDSHREESPLIQATDALVLDNSNLTEAQQLDYALKLVWKRR